ncbi:MULTISPECIES: hypothetical protein [unclassified Mesorhizobium]|uniref:hypothetical protein n=1 Tax=unclassified Mesorhizobium TaxID=325217 RepID=UPI001FE0A558|nr:MULTISPECIES: hypothetical protein [unclassified Mesorhizobium]
MFYGSEFIMKVVLVLAVLSPALLLGGVGYRYYAGWKAQHIAVALGGEVSE